MTGFGRVLFRSSTLPSRCLWLGATYVLTAFVRSPSLVGLDRPEVVGQFDPSHLGDFVHRWQAVNQAGDEVGSTAALSATSGIPDRDLVDFQIGDGLRSEEHTSELQSRRNLVCRLLLEKKKT